MTLRFETDTSYADWWAKRDEPWERLCSVGPSGFEAYVRIFFWLEPDADPTKLADVEMYEGPLPPAQLTILSTILAQHTSTPDDCFFGLWEGGGYDPQLETGPRFHIPNRAYWLFHGRLDEATDWGVSGAVFGPQLMWPADHAWLFADEIDVPWVVVGGAQQLIDEIVADERFDAEQFQFGEQLSYHRHVSR